MFCEIYWWLITIITFLKQIVVEGDETNPTEGITHYPIKDIADNSGT
jgi:hypothetical protein